MARVEAHGVIQGQDFPADGSDQGLAAPALQVGAPHAALEHGIAGKAVLPHQKAAASRSVTGCVRFSQLRTLPPRNPARLRKAEKNASWTASAAPSVSGTIRATSAYSWSW